MIQGDGEGGWYKRKTDVAHDCSTVTDLEWQWIRRKRSESRESTVMTKVDESQREESERFLFGGGRRISTKCWSTKEEKVLLLLNGCIDRLTCQCQWSNEKHKEKVAGTTHTNIPSNLCMYVLWLCSLWQNRVTAPAQISYRPSHHSLSIKSAVVIDTSERHG